MYEYFTMYSLHAPASLSQPPQLDHSTSHARLKSNTYIHTYRHYVLPLCTGRQLLIHRLPCTILKFSARSEPTRSESSDRLIGPTSSLLHCKYSCTYSTLVGLPWSVTIHLSPPRLSRLRFSPPQKKIYAESRKEARQGWTKNHSKYYIS